MGNQFEENHKEWMKKRKYRWYYYYYSTKIMIIDNFINLFKFTKFGKKYNESFRTPKK